MAVENNHAILIKCGDRERVVGCEEHVGSLDLIKGFLSVVDEATGEKSVTDVNILTIGPPRSEYIIWTIECRGESCRLEVPESFAFDDLAGIQVYGDESRQSQSQHEFLPQSSEESQVADTGINVVLVDRGTDPPLIEKTNLGVQKPVSKITHFRVGQCEPVPVIYDVEGLEPGEDHKIVFLILNRRKHTFLVEKSLRIADVDGFLFKADSPEMPHVTPNVTDPRPSTSMSTAKCRHEVVGNSRGVLLPADQEETEAEPSSGTKIDGSRNEGESCLASNQGEREGQETPQEGGQLPLEPISKRSFSMNRRENRCFKLKYGETTSTVRHPHYEPLCEITAFVSRMGNGRPIRYEATLIDTDGPVSPRDGFQIVSVESEGQISRFYVSIEFHPEDYWYDIEFGQEHESQDSEDVPTSRPDTVSSRRMDAAENEGREDEIEIGNASGVLLPVGAELDLMDLRIGTRGLPSPLPSPVSSVDTSPSSTTSSPHVSQKKLAQKKDIWKDSQTPAAG